MPPNSALEPTPFGRLAPACGFPRGGEIVTPRGAAQRERWADERQSGRFREVEFWRRAEIEGLPRNDDRELLGGGEER